MHDRSVSNPTDYSTLDTDKGGACAYRRIHFSLQDSLTASHLSASAI